MNIVPDPSVPNTSPYTVPFFHDFMLVLMRLDKQPIKRTVTGNISLSDIKELLQQFKQQERIEEYKKYGWHLRREEELQFLTQIKIIAEVMYLTYNRKGFLHLSNSGKAYLKNIEPLIQYQNMVLHYWFRVNWGYFTSGGRVISEMNFAEKLQHVQKDVLRALLKKGEIWQDYKQFCLSLRDYFQLAPYIRDSYDTEHNLFFHICLILFDRNLLQLGCVEVMEEANKKNHWDKNIIKFRPTQLGLYVFHKALFENYL